MTNIPRLVHQTAPRDVQQWHPLWARCRESWIASHAGFDYRMWHDEDIDAFIRERFPEVQSLLRDRQPPQIVTLDIFRYMLLYVHGGIYADMDIYCYRQFHGELAGDVFLVEGSENTDELVQNSLMAAAPGQAFFAACIDEAARRLASSTVTELTTPDPAVPDLPLSSRAVRALSGPLLLSDVARRHEIGILPRATYNPHHLSYRDTYRTKHMLTGRWGLVVLDTLRERGRADGIDETDREMQRQDYLGFREVDIDDFDFKKNYR